jgi:2-C-methyl-D-erythritol 4-phosphate cytidylyltransferase
MNIAIILSAGSGKRLGSEIPKQLLKLNGVRIINYSIQKFQDSEFIDGIVLVSHHEQLEVSKKIAEAFSKVLAVITGGERRQDSVFNALSWIKEQGNTCEKVFIHDAARPLFTKDLLNSLYIESKNKLALIPCIPLEDTVKLVKDNAIDSTLERKNIVRVQTPQVFDFDKLYSSYLKFPKNLLATDDAFVMEYFGEEVKIISGEKKNIKITYPDDIKLAEYLIKY